MEVEAIVQGADETAQALLGAVDLFQQDTLVELVSFVAQIVVDEAITNAPVAEDGEHVPRGHKPGTLKNKGIGYKIIKGMTSPDSATAAIGFTRKGFYGLFLELGTVHAGPRPFIVPAFEAKKTEIYTQIGQAVSKSIETYQQGGQYGFFRSKSFSSSYDPNNG